MKQSQDSERFEAYGSYSYAYRHPQEQPPEETYQPQQSEYSPVTPAAEQVKARARSRTGRLLFVLVILVISLLVLEGTVFRLQTVYVIGNKTKSAQQIAAASGLVRGANIFAVKSEDVQRNLASDHTIVFEGMQKEYPGTIYLYVSERDEVAVMQWLGIQYTLDAEGIVMQETASLILPENMPAVTGMQVTNVHVGQQLNVRNAAQLTAYQQIMSELTLQLYVDQISELNLYNMENLYLVTADGISVRLGSDEHIAAKIVAMRTDLAYLRQLGKTSGTLDVSTPEDAKFTPE